MRTFLLSAAIAAACLTSTMSRADFTVKGAVQPPTSPNPSDRTDVVADQPHIDPGDGRAVLEKQVRPRLVTGFGDQVPLSFACRQIVPRGVRVSYGQGASPDALVDWKGGESWPLVLGRAIKPLGLRMVSAGTTLTIKH